MLNEKMYQSEDDENLNVAHEGVFFLGLDEELAKQSFCIPVVNSKGIVVSKIKKQLSAWDCLQVPTGLRHADPYLKGYLNEVPVLGADPYAKLFKFNDVPVVDPDPNANQKAMWRNVLASGIELNLANVQTPAPSPLQVAPPARDVSVAQLQAKVRFLEAQLRTDLPYLELYKFGGVSLFVAVISLVLWAVTGIGVPFHPVFAAMAVPVAIGVMVMAFFLRREAHD